jgi:hypothetical protein
MTTNDLIAYAIVAFFFTIVVWWMRTMEDYTQY